MFIVSFCYSRFLFLILTLQVKHFFLNSILNFGVRSKDDYYLIILSKNALNVIKRYLHCQMARRRKIEVRSETFISKKRSKNSFGRRVKSIFEYKKKKENKIDISLECSSTVLIKNLIFFWKHTQKKKHTKKPREKRIEVEKKEKKTIKKVVFHHFCCW